MPYVLDRGVMVNLLAGACFVEVCTVKRVLVSDLSLKRPLILPAYEDQPVQRFDEANMLPPDAKSANAFYFKTEPFLRYAAEVPDMEADICALAESEKAILVTDCLKLRKCYLSGKAEQKRILDTTGFLKEAFNDLGYSPDQGSKIAHRITHRGHFLPCRFAVEPTWWDSLKTGRNGQSNGRSNP
jgi:hypothetical protein